MESVDETFLLLTVTPDTRQGLLIACTIEDVPEVSLRSSDQTCIYYSRVPSGIKEDQAVGTNQIDTTASSFATEQENEFLALGIVEAVDQLLTLVDVHRSVKTQTSVPGRRGRLVTTHATGC